MRSLRVLGEAKQRGYIAAVQPFVEELLACGYWIEEDVVCTFLQEMRELPPTVEQHP
jgi:predicted nucleic acid-binding protein